MSHPQPEGSRATTAEPAGDSGPVVVGVHLGQPVEVLLQAARLARELGRTLACVFIASDVIATGWDRAEHFELDSEFEDGTSEEDLAPELVEAIRAALEPSDQAPEWSIRVLSGDVAVELDDFASEVEARLIVVGGRRRGHFLAHLTSGAVSSHLAHNQPRPLVVIPDPGHRAARLVAPAPASALEEPQ